MPGHVGWTGVPELDAAIATVLEAGHIHYGWEGHHYDPLSPPLAHFSTPQAAGGMCQTVSEPLSYAFRDLGLYSSLEVILPHTLGYDPSGWPGERWPLHQVNVIARLSEDERYLLDFTAAQYGEQEFPATFKLGDSALRWERISLTASRNELMLGSDRLS
jgi:hypothetical protein